MKILHLIQTSGPGGAEKLLLTLAKNSKDQYTSIIGLLKNGWLLKQLQNHDVKVKIIPSDGSFDLKLIKNLVDIIKKEKIDLIHSHLLDMNFYSSLAAKVAGIPHISTEHGDIHHTSKKLDKKTLIKAKTISHFSDKIVFVSKFTRDKFLKITKVPERKIAIIYNGIDLKNCEKPIDVEKKRAELGIKNNEFVIGNVANLYPVKGQIYLLKAAKKVIKEFPNTKFLLIGRGELEEKLKKEAQNLGIAPHIKFLGFRNDVKELLKIMDVFVLCSLSEGLPLSLIEAMASKVPVVCTNVGGIPEVIEDGINGFLVPVANSIILAEKIIYLLKNKTLSNNFTLYGYQKIKQQFSLQSMLDKYAEIYSDLMTMN